MGLFSGNKNKVSKTLKYIGLTRDVLAQVHTGNYNKIDWVLARKLANYMETDEPIDFPKGVVVDPINDKKIDCFVRSDGEWVWYDYQIYYIKKYQISPGDNFINHVMQNYYNRRYLSKEDIEKILRKLKQKDKVEYY